MLGSELVTFLEGLVDDTVNENLALALLNSIKENIETERPWAYLAAEDSFSVTQNTDFSGTLPEDFSDIIKVTDEDGREILMTTREDRITASGDRYYIWDGKLYLTYQYGKDTTIYIYYKKFSEAIEADETVDFPDRWINILGYYGAAQYFALDAGEKQMAWDDRWYKIAEDLKRSMIRWDNSINYRKYNDEMKQDTGYYRSKQNI